jgi:hypothetical protein
MMVVETHAISTKVEIEQINPERSFFITENYGYEKFVAYCNSFATSAAISWCRLLSSGVPISDQDM